MPQEGLEPPRALCPLRPERSASASSATAAYTLKHSTSMAWCQIQRESIKVQRQEGWAVLQQPGLPARVASRYTSSGMWQSVRRGYSGRLPVHCSHVCSPHRCKGDERAARQAIHQQKFPENERTVLSAQPHSRFDVLFPSTDPPRRSPILCSSDRWRRSGCCATAGKGLDHRPVSSR